MVLLKLLVYLSLLTIAYGSTDEDLKSEFIHMLVICHVEYPVTPKELEMMQRLEIPPGTNAKCIVSCVFKKIKWITKKGTFDVNQAYALAEEKYSDDPTKIENAKKLIDMCKKVNDDPVTDGQKGCDRSFLLSSCLLEHAPQLGFTV